MTTVLVREGQSVEKGQALLAIEAMKMETQLHAEHSGKVDSVVIRPGAQIDAGDLLIVMS